MSRKRPTESSWDSDDDLLRDDLPGITAFAKTKREESDEEFDEDALLGSDDEGNNNKSKSNAGVEISMLNDTETFDNEDSDMSYAQDNKTFDDQTEETFEIGVEDSELAEFEGEDFEAEAVEIRKLGEGVGYVQSATIEPAIDDSQTTQDQSYQDDNETEDLNESEIKKADSDSDEDEDEDDEKDKNNRDRFKSERSTNVVIKSSSITRTDIPDTLEISEEQQAQIDDFMDNQGKRKGQRGFRGRGQGKFPDRQNRNGPPQNQHPRFNRPPAPYLLQQGGHRQDPRHPYGPPAPHGGFRPQQFHGYPNRHPQERFQSVGPYPTSQGYNPHDHQHGPPVQHHGPPPPHYGQQHGHPVQQHGPPTQHHGPPPVQHHGPPPQQHGPPPQQHGPPPQQHGPPPQQHGPPPQQHGPPPQQHGPPPQQHGPPEYGPPQHHQVPPEHQQAPEEQQHLPPDHHIETEDIVPPDHHLPPDYALDGPPSPVSMDTQTNLSTATQPAPGTPRKVFVNPHFKPKGPPPTSQAWSATTSNSVFTSLHAQPVQPVLPSSQQQTSYSSPQMSSWTPQQSAAIPTSSASYQRPPLHPQHYHDSRTPVHTAAPPSLMAQSSYPPARPPYHQPQSLLGPGPHHLHQGALVYSGGPPSTHVRPLLQHTPQAVPQYHQNQPPRNQVPVSRFPQHHPQYPQPYHQQVSHQDAVRPGQFQNNRTPRPNFQGHGRGRGQGQGGPMSRTPPNNQISPNVPASQARGQKRLSSSEAPPAVVPEKVAKPAQPPKPEEPVDEETRLLNEKIAEQKKLREKLIKQKEMKRRLAAAQKKKDLEKRLAEKGMTLADIGADSTESETDSIPPKQPEKPGTSKPQRMQKQQTFQQPQHQGGGNLRHPRPQMTQQVPNNPQQRLPNPQQRPSHPQQRQANPQQFQPHHQHQQNQFHMRPPHQQGNRMEPPRHGTPHPMNRFPNQQNQHPQMRMQTPRPQGGRMQTPRPQGGRMQTPGPQGHRMQPPGPQGHRMQAPGSQGHGFSSFNNQQNNPQGMRPPFQGERSPNGDFNTPQGFSHPPVGPNRGRGGVNPRGNMMNRGRGNVGNNSARGNGNLSQANAGRGNIPMCGGFVGRGNLGNRGNFANRGRGRGMTGNVGNQQQQQGNLQQVKIVDNSNDRQVIMPGNEGQNPNNRVVTQQPIRIVTQKQQMANQMKKLATKSLAKANNIISLRKVKVGGQNDNSRVVVQAARTVIAQSKKSQLVCIDNLSASTTKQQLTQLCNNVGPVETIKIDPCTKKALVKFQSTEHAVSFSKKFNRHMIDLSHITVSLVPG